jgi:nicotinate-nucleotide adenylyltransferase
MIGADSWSEITTWHEWQRLLRMCDLIVVTRPGYDLSGSIANASAQVVDVRGATRREVSEALAGGDGGKGPRVFLTGAAMVDISATEIRAAARAGEGEQLRAMVPMAVASYIEKYELYKN